MENIYNIFEKKHNLKAAPQKSVLRRFSTVLTETASQSQSGASIVLLDLDQMIYFKLVENSIDSKYIVWRDTGPGNINDWGEMFGFWSQSIVGICEPLRCNVINQSEE